MPFEYIDLETARGASGLRMVVVSGVPSPWGEAAKGILHVKNIPWQAVRLDAGSDEMAAWSGDRSGPVAIYNDETPRSSWAEILLLAERLAPSPALLPENAEERALVMGLCHEICGEDGLGWARRLQGIHDGLKGKPGFPAPVAGYLGDKYGYRESEAPRQTARVAALLGVLAQRLQTQKARGSDYYFGDSMTAVDLYSATFMALFQPLPAEQCAMPEALRTAFEAIDEITKQALEPILISHRDQMYAKHLELPLSL